VIVAFSAFAPHMGSELLEQLFAKELGDCRWPAYDPALAAVDEASVAVQINGKTRELITCAKGRAQAEVEEQAKTVVSKWLANKTIVRVIFVPDRLINFVIREG
jgi:leucyl-tRNA synthetase